MKTTDRRRVSGGFSAFLCLVLLLAAFPASVLGADKAATAGDAKDEIAGDDARPGKVVPAGEYICPMCYPAQDPKVHDQPGSCPVCGMPLIEKSRRTNVAILIFDGVQIIDYTGPYEVFGQAQFTVFTVSEKGAPITTSMGMSVNPTYSFETSPEPTILVIPGGAVDGQYGNPRVLDWIRGKAGTAKYVLSVCNGAFILARTGLLDGLSATTFYGLIDQFRTFAPKVKVVTDQRFVDNGRIITSAGLSSGIDAALHVVEKLLGQGRAASVALHMEYDWRPDSGFARAALADRRLPDIDFPEGVRLEPVDIRGDRNHWEAGYTVTGKMSAPEALDFLDAQLAKLSSWKKVEMKAAAAKHRTTWNFKDDQGAIWVCETFLGPPGAGTDQPTLAYTLRRAGPARKDPEATAKGTSGR